MKQRIPILFLLLSLSGCISAKDVSSKLEVPHISRGDIILDYEGFTISYNSKNLIPNWVAYEITDIETQGSFPRKGNFGMDMNYRGRQAMREDYSNSGWDKGHMAPAADMKWSETAMRESFYLTNVCPQDHELNGNSWQKLEKKVRELAQIYGKVYVVCGPIIESGKYGTIGARKVRVPDAFFKALLIPYQGSYSAIAFIMDNNAEPHQLTKSFLSVNELEKIINLDLFVNLNDEIEDTIEQNVMYSAWRLKE